MALVTVPRPLREKLGDEASEALVQLLNEAGLKTRDNVIELASERFERRLAEELAKIRTEMAEMKATLRTEMAEMGAALRTEMGEMKTELRTEMGGMEARLRTEMAEMGATLRTEIAEMGATLRTEMARKHTETIRWMFIFWIGQIAVLGGLILALLSRG
jgi:hypothetical protein